MKSRGTRSRSGTSGAIRRLGTAGRVVATTAATVLLAGIATAPSATAESGTPATPYAATEPYADRRPDARVLTIEGWGHTVLGKSTCADLAVAVYLIDLVAADGATCAQDLVPFAQPAPAGAQQVQLAASAR